MTENSEKSEKPTVEEVTTDIVTDEEVELWFKRDDFEEMDPNKNIYPYVSVFNRKNYTVGGPKEVYFKYSRVNKLIPSHDELAFLDTRSCVFRVSYDRFIVVVGYPDPNSKEYAVLGELGARYITKNDFVSYDIEISKAERAKIISLADFYDPTSLTAEKLIDAASRRITSMFDDFIKDVRA